MIQTFFEQFASCPSWNIHHNDDRWMIARLEAAMTEFCHHIVYINFSHYDIEFI